MCGRNEFLAKPSTENAALPHGSGTDRVLNSSDFALFDCTGSLHGYYSDVTRVSAVIVVFSVLTCVARP